jgi:hypothetical protein
MLTSFNEINGIEVNALPDLRANAALTLSDDLWIRAFNHLHIH